MGKTIYQRATLLLGWLIPSLTVIVVLVGNTQPTSVVPKNFFVLLAAGIFGLVFCLRLMYETKTSLLAGRLALMLFVTALLVLLSLIGMTNPLQALIRPELPLLPLLLIFYLSVSILRTTDHRQRFFDALWLASLALSGWSLVKLSPLAKLGAFSSLSSLLTSNLGFVEVLPLAASGLILGWYFLRESSSMARRRTLGVLIVLILVALVAGVRNTGASGHAPARLSWAVTVDQLKSPHETLLGIGLSRYQVLLTKYRPVWFNLEPNWSETFSTGYNALLTLVGTTGLVVTTLVIYLIYSVIQSHKMNIDLDSKTSVVLRLITLVFVAANLVLPTSPVNATLLILTLIIMVLELKQAESRAVVVVELNHSQLKPPRIPKTMRGESTGHRLVQVLALLLALPLVLGMGFFTRSYLAEFYWARSLTAAANNRNIDAYEWQKKAVRLYPFDPTYRLAYSLTNLGLAVKLAPESNDEETGSNIITLVSQAIREAEAATKLAPDSALAWYNLAIAYRQLVGSAANAHSWSLGAFAKAVNLDPKNPALPMDLGGIYLSMKDYQQALVFFDQAHQLKANWPKAYYNLALVYLQLGDHETAQAMLFQAGRLTNPEDPDYTVINDALKKI